jgi:hypothetical protein
VSLILPKNTYLRICERFRPKKCPYLTKILFGQSEKNSQVKSIIFTLLKE